MLPQCRFLTFRHARLALRFMMGQYVSKDAINATLHDNVKQPAGPALHFI